MPGLGGKSVERYEIIDGQQRILALAQYLSNDFALLGAEDPKLRLPLSLRSVGAPWAGKRYSDLPGELRDTIHGHEILVHLVRDVNNPDEVRDLFIRLQSGTALTRQQIRDAWPGDLGPRVERWAGKLSKSPKYKFFQAVDGRGTRDDEDDTNDMYVKHRTTCAQLCRLLLAHATNPYEVPSIKAGDLDALYHANTQVDTTSNPLDSVEQVFVVLEDIVSRIVVKPSGRRKVAKITLFALSLFLQDASRSSLFKLTSEAKNKLAYETANPKITSNSRASSGGVIKDYYERWRESLPSGIGIGLDPNRTFGEADRGIIRNRQSSKCAVCKEFVQLEDEEYDHYPIPYRDGGITNRDNGRLVHRDCHPRGRPIEE